MAFCFGTTPGTITLNHWVSSRGSLNTAIEIGTDIKPRRVSLLSIIDRLRYIERGFEEDYPDLMYRNLYEKLIHDPGKHSNPHRGMEQQIADLITVLSHKDWVDFSRPENQVIAKYFTSRDQGKYQRFFHQLLLSIELFVRIHSKQHTSWAKAKCKV
jgi:hypothetical protein